MEIENQVQSIAAILGKKTKRKNHTSNRKVSKVTPRHVWSIAEEKLAISLYYNEANEDEIKLAIESTELKLSSMKMKISNIRYLDTGEGLANVSELTKTLFEKSSLTKNK